MTAAPDFVTVIHSPRRRLAKCVRADGQIQDYDHARTFDMSMVQVDSLDHLLVRLVCLLSRPDLAIVRAAIIDPTRTRGIRRLIQQDPKTGDIPTLIEASHYWIALDVDGAARPDGVPATDILACADSVIPLLPGEFRTARAIVQATSGHGLKAGSRLRLWFWAERPLSGRELSYWMRRSPVDNSLFSPAQICYTSAPCFADGLVDHLPCRLVERAGTRCVETPSAEALTPPPPPPPPSYTPPRKLASPDQHAMRVMSTMLARVETSIPHERHNALRAAAYTIGGLIDTHGISEAAAAAALMAAIARAAGADADPRKDADTIASGLRRGREHPLITGGNHA